MLIYFLKILIIESLKQMVIIIEMNEKNKNVNRYKNNLITIQD